VSQGRAEQLTAERTRNELPTLRVIEPNLAGPSGHYAEFIRALAARSDGIFRAIEVVAAPRASSFLASLGSAVPVEAVALPSGPLAELRAIRASLQAGRRTLVLTATALHALAADRGAFLSRSKLGALSMFVHWPLAKPRDRVSLTLAARVRAESLFLVPTSGVRTSLLESDCDHVAQIAYPATRAEQVRLQAPFKHLLMAGAARINKGLDVIAGLAELLARDARLAAAEGVSSTNELLAEPPLLVQVSPKHVGKTGHDRHGAREDAVVARLLAANYRGLVADPKAPDRDEDAKRFEGALVLAPYERAKFADGVSGVVLDALLHGAPVVATSGTWAGDVVERFDAGISIRDRTPEALRAAVARILGRWDVYLANAAKASETLAAEHDPRALALAIASHG
jgi:hypothetical protein